MADPKAKMVQVSVVIPTYNCAAYLADALQSVYQQTLKNMEVVVVDDGSNDNTLDVIAPWRDRIVYIEQERAGVAAARNAGIAASTAPYVAFLDADDVWLPAKLEMQVAALESKQDAGMACTDFSVLYDDGKRTHSFFSGNPPLADRDLFIRMVENCFAFPSVVMIRRDVLQRCGVFDTSAGVAEDMNLWLRVAHDYKVAIVPKVLCVKRERLAAVLLHPEHQVPAGEANCAKPEREGRGRPYELTVTAEIGALQKVLSSFPAMAEPRRRAVRRQIGKLQCDFGKYLLMQDQQRRSRETLARALRSRPLRAATLFALTLCPTGIFRSVRRLKRSFMVFRERSI